MLVTDAEAARARLCVVSPFRSPLQSSPDSGSAKGGLAVTGSRARGKNGVDGWDVNGGHATTCIRAHITSSVIYAIPRQQRLLWGGWTGKGSVPVGQNGNTRRRGTWDAAGRDRPTDGKPPVG